MFKQIATVAMSASMLSACVVAIGHDRDHDWDDDYDGGIQITVDDSDNGRNGTSIRLQNGKRVSLKCPKGYEVYIEETDDKVASYGCKAKGATT